jgi:preprotein translocase subunit SecA
MFNWIIKKIIGTKNDRIVKSCKPLVARINEIELGLQSKEESFLRERCEAWKQEFKAFHEPKFLAGVNLRIADEGRVNESREYLLEYWELLKREFGSFELGGLEEGLWTTMDLAKKKEALDAAREAWMKVESQFSSRQKKKLEEILPECYAVVKNAARRLCGGDITVCDTEMKWNMVHFDVQLVGGIALHRGMIAEMATGEGKTLVATLPVVLNALTGLGVHVITVNDYLARRDSEWMGYLYKMLGLSVGCIQGEMESRERRGVYACDITYGTNSEFGFDYLRDNGMAVEESQRVQRRHYFAIVDEVDSVLIDEARTPLIISGPVAASESSHQYEKYNPLIDQLVKRQNALCNKMISDAKELFDKKSLNEAGQKLLQVQMGQPRNRAFMRCMEDSEMRRALEKAELALLEDTQKTELFKLKEELYYSIEEKNHEADLTEKGRTFLSPNDPDGFVLPDLASLFTDIDVNINLTVSERTKRKTELQDQLAFQGQKIHQISQLLRAHCLYEKDVDYVVEENKVMIVDPQTGRKMAGRRWSDGLHQAVEAKENVHIDDETQTLATITIQNYFRLYQKLGGMTGTAETDAAEFHDIYHLDVLNIPTNQVVKRVDDNDSIFKTRREKFNAVLELIHSLYAKGQPILVGTASVEASEMLSRMLKMQKIPHAVLNAKYHMQEAEIVARAGQKGSVTISTNMAGRGTDIKLGEGVAELGGLFVLGTERHESRRVDRQLRGRSARQGDPGQSKFFISFEDDLMRNFAAADKMTKMMELFGMKDGEELTHPMLNHSVESAQKKVEQRNYMWRKRVLEFDNVMNQQREVIYELRSEALTTQDPHVLIKDIASIGIEDTIRNLVVEEVVDVEGLVSWVHLHFPIGITEAEMKGLSVDELVEKVRNAIFEAYELKIETADPQLLQDLEKRLMLNAIDRLWQEHLYALDSLKEGINLRTYGQKDPIIEFKQEAFKIFAELMANIRLEVAVNLFRNAQQILSFEQFLKKAAEDHVRQQNKDMSRNSSLNANGKDGDEVSHKNGGKGEKKEADASPSTARHMPVSLMKRPEVVVGRNDPCICGSGKKYKQCCGRLK